MAIFAYFQQNDIHGNFSEFGQVKIQLYLINLALIFFD